MLACLFFLILCCTAPAPTGSSPTPSTPHRAAPSPATPTPLPGTPEAGLIYEVYVRSYQDSDGDGIGDLAGLTTRLDYIASLGVGTLWLLPLTPSATPDGSAVLDHATLDAGYGDTEALRRLTIEAHERGITVLVEAPLNAVSADHPAFRTALADEASPERALFRFRADPPDGPGWVAAGKEWYYASGGPDLPDLDWTNPAVAAVVLDPLREWIDLGVDGFVYRDVHALVESPVPAPPVPASPVRTAPDLAASRALLVDIATELHAHDDSVRLLVGTDDDTVAGTVAWLDTPEEPGAEIALDTPRHTTMLDALQLADRASLLDVLAAETPYVARLSPFLGSDRLPRLADTLVDPRARRVAMVLHLLSARQPVLYYGEELDLVGATSEGLPDAPWRGLMRWDETQGAGFSTAEPWFPLDPGLGDRHDVADELADKDSMLRLVGALADLRAQSPAARTGSFTVLPTDDARAFAFERSSSNGGGGGERVVVIVNLTGDELADLRVQVAGPFEDLTAPGERHEEGDQLAFTPVPPYAYHVLVDGVARPHPIPVVR